MKKNVKRTRAKKNGEEKNGRISRDAGTEKLLSQLFQRNKKRPANFREDVFRKLGKIASFLKETRDGS